MSQQQEWLKELTSTPTAAGREQHVLAWIKRFVGQRPGLRMTQDEAGNVTLRRDLAPSALPIYIEAHMDHPAFVCVKSDSARSAVAQFRGGVAERFFVGTGVRLWPADRPAVRGTVAGLLQSTEQDNFGANDADKHYRIEFESDCWAQPGDIITWDLPAARVENGILHAPACDDLAGVAAAMAAMDNLLKLADQGTHIGDVRLLLTRAEEIGFVGAIAACKLGTIPHGARIVALENSKSFPESPIGAGPIVRVGDYTSTFDPDLTYRIGRIAQSMAAEDKTFKYQRKLMPGGTCEASAFQSWGITATCVCLALGNYHNMNEQSGKIEPEYISTDDFDNLVRLLVQVVLRLDDPAAAPTLKARLEQLYEGRRKVLTPLE